MHGLRVLLFAAIVLLIHLQQQRRMQSVDRAAAPPAPPLEIVHRVMPAADRLRAAVDVVDRHEVLDAAGRPIGTIAQTSPVSDGIIGFSGPTNVAIGFDDDDHVTGVVVVSSGDTREHVQQIERDPRFLQSWNGLSREGAGRLRQVDAVSGATLTSLAIAESIAARLEGPRTSLRFPEPLTVEDAQQLFPRAATVRPIHKGPGVGS